MIADIIRESMWTHKMHDAARFRAGAGALRAGIRACVRAFAAREAARALCGVGRWAGVLVGFAKAGV